MLKKETNGFVLNRLQYALLMEAWRLVEVCPCVWLGGYWVGLGMMQHVTCLIRRRSLKFSYIERFIDR